MRLSAFFFEIVPISGFFIGSQYYNLIIAAFISLLLSLFVMATFYVLEKRISKFQIFAICMSALFTLFAYMFDDNNSVRQCLTGLGIRCYNPTSYNETKKVI